MSIESMKERTFPSGSYEDWKQNAEAALKGKPFDSLFTQTPEGIVLEPLYTKRTLEQLGDRLEQQVQAVRSGKASASFFAAQEGEGGSARQFLTDTREQLARGNDMIVYSDAERLDWSDEELGELKKLAMEHPVYFKVSDRQSPVLRLFDVLEPADQKRLNGVVLSEEPVTAPEGIRTLSIDTVPVHHAGGSAVQELGVALSMLAEKVDGARFEESMRNIWVRFAVGTDFFSEIAKLRAFRVLWTAFCSAYGKKAEPIPVFTETSLRSYSKLDPYVNLLRAGNSAFSAILGGTDAHTVFPHNILTGTTPASRRMARNVLLVIREETHIRHITDAAAGSYFIEKLTADYIDAAYAYFLEIEEKGGYMEALQSGWLADGLQAVWKEREEKAATRKTSLIGTNVYADPAEQIPEDTKEQRAENMTAKRLAEPFEQLRRTLAASPPKTAILHFGPLKEVKAKSDFVRGILAVGGLVPEVSEELEDAEAAQAFVLQHGIQYAVLVGKYDKLETVVPALQLTGAVLDVAGTYKPNEIAFLKANGITGTVRAGQHILEKFEQIAQAGKGRV